LVDKSPEALSRRTFLTASGALLLAGCASGNEGAAGNVEVPDVRLGVLAVPDTAPLYVADREGIFRSGGLRPKMVDSQLTGDNRFDLEHGTEDIHFDSWVTIFLNIADGADWVLVGEAYQAGDNTTALVTAPRSKLRRIRDLKGTRIAVNNPRGLGVMLITALLSANGLAPSDVTFVETPFDKIGAAVQRGDAESGWLVEPYLTLAQLETGATPLADTATGPTADLPQSGYVCARSFAERNPRTMRAFQSALVRAQVAAQDRTVIERELTGYLKVTPRVAALMNVGTFPGSLRAVRPQRVADLMLEQGMLNRPIKVADRIFA
jgi:NitT/TauT family transport system substrate-binding protein